MENSVIKILIPKDDPNGLRIVTLNGWIGKAFMIPRTDLNDIKKFPEASLPAVYFLFGESKDIKPIVYIGQTDNFFRRINQQNTDKNDDDWNFAIVFTGESEIDVQYLEKKCIEEVKNANRYKLTNKAGSPGRNISPIEKVVNDAFFVKVKFITSLLNFPIFLGKPTEKQTKNENVYVLEDFKNKDAYGRGTILPNQEFVVFSGSRARVEEKEGFKKHVKSSVILRKKLEIEGIYKKESNNKSFIFIKDYIFSSPSAAADVIMGRACNGWTGWKDDLGNTLDKNIRRKN
ncbi:MAG: GIY-YIG nuclease family protein [Candidatus Paceibacterota bacterium]|jgi:hypothetical protein